MSTTLTALVIAVAVMLTGSGIVSAAELQQTVDAGATVEWCGYDR